ncbi:MAG: DUF3488 and transglutaminase-like domain-containing protein [Opitutaceae bacterium]|nr:DUF3488 and transglutaminase-like domain-containing protein [Opitutaceae bacterium]
MSTTAAPRPQLTLDELHHLKWVLGSLLTLVGLGAVFYLEVEAWTLTGVTAACTIATMLRPGLPARVPGFVHTLAFPLIVGFFIADVWRRGEVLPAIVRLDILLLLYRNITYRQRRDDLQLIVLGLFIIIVAGVLSVSPTFAVQLLVFAACALALLLVVTLADSLAGPAARAPLAPGAMPAWAKRADVAHLIGRLRAVLDWRVLVLGTVLFGGVVAVSALLFLAIPRFQLENSMFLERFIAKKAKTGFSDSIRFGDVTEIQQDTSIALSVDVSDHKHIPASPYWRMIVLDSYEGGVFRMSSRLKQRELMPERSGTTAGGAVRPRRGEAVYWTFYLESGVSRFLPLVGPFQTISFHEAQHFRVAPRLAMVALREEPVTMTAYRVEDFDLSGTVPDLRFAENWRARTEGAPPREEHQVALPLTAAEHAVVERAVAEATGGARPEAGEFARLAGEWLRRQHAYSLAPQIPAGEGDALVRWLASRGSGHCELFAGSLVLMAREAGFPARIVTGFRGGSWNGYSNNFTIRNSDAHAWTEIFDERSGAWLRADPLGSGASAADEVRGEAAVASRLDRSWKARLDSLRMLWYRRIVSFDQQAQAEALQAVKDVARSSGREVRERLEAVVAAIKGWLAAPWGWTRGLGVAGVVALAGAAVWLLGRFGPGLWRRLALRRGVRGEDPVRREAGRWLGRLGQAEPAPEHAEVRADLLRLRFGARASWAKPEAVFRRARQTVRTARPRGRVTRS